MIVIGSTAIRYWFEDFPREPKDIDIICNDDTAEYINKRWDTLMILKGDKKVERLRNPIVLDLYFQNKDESLVYLSPEYLATLKASHLFWDLNWEKHMWDLQFLLRRGCRINEEMFWKLYAYWNEFHAKNKRSDLKMSKEDFFTNKVNYDTGEHDFVHTILNPIPVYSTILKDGCEVELDPEKYKLLSHENKVKLVQEEVMNMAWERYRQYNFRKAYNKMLKKFIISHAPVFSLQFILENYNEISLCPYNYYDVIKEGLNNKQLKQEYA